MLIMTARVRRDRQRVQIPADMNTVRAAGRDTAMRWRMHLREIVTGLLSRGYRVTAFNRADAANLPYYVLTQRHLP